MEVEAAWQAERAGEGLLEQRQQQGQMNVLQGSCQMNMLFSRGCRLCGKPGRRGSNWQTASHAACSRAGPPESNSMPGHRVGPERGPGLPKGPSRIGQEPDFHSHLPGSASGSCCPLWLLSSPTKQGERLLPYRPVHTLSPLAFGQLPAGIAPFSSSPKERDSWQPRPEKPQSNHGYIDTAVPASLVTSRLMIPPLSMTWGVTGKRNQIVFLTFISTVHVCSAFPVWSWSS